jgi:hypothetical protein
MRICFLGNFGVSFSSESHHKATLERLGHEVIALQEGRAQSNDILREASISDLFVWVHTHAWTTPGEMSMVAVLERLRRYGVPTMTYHLDLWFGIERQKDLEHDEFYKHIGHFFTVDKLMADWFNENTSVKGHYIQAGVFEPECYLIEKEPTNDVIFVGSRRYHPEWQYRPQLIDWLRDTYKDRFLHYGGDGVGVVRGDALNRLYADTKVAVGDSLCINFDYPHYWSDRVYETLGRGGFLIMPHVKGMEKHFDDGIHLVFYQYGNFEQLKGLIDYYLEHEYKREAIRRAGHEHVKKNHTYTNRWQEILEVIANG